MNKHGRAAVDDLGCTWNVSISVDGEDETREIESRMHAALCERRK
jgi:hypothetical protein